jgi:hypothetical protein
MKKSRPGDLVVSAVATWPTLLVVCEWAGGWSALGTLLLMPTLKYASDRGASGLDFRCCSWERIDLVLATGSDVPPSVPLWTDSFPDKALEYGGDDRKVLLVFRADRLEPSFRTTAADITAEERSALLLNYPNLLEFPDDPRPLWFSRVLDNRAGSPYEAAHGRWIPGDPLDALLMIVGLGRDHGALRSDIGNAVARCEARKWTLENTAAAEQFVTDLAVSRP